MVALSLVMPTASSAQSASSRRGATQPSRKPEQGERFKAPLNRIESRINNRIDLRLNSKIDKNNSVDASTETSIKVKQSAGGI